MSGLYNMVMGQNPFFGILTAMVGIHKENGQLFGRVRDAWIDENADTIGVLHRNYGDDGKEFNEAAEALPAFKEHRSEGDDHTYVSWIFEVPEQHLSAAADISRASDNTPCFDRFKQAIADLQAGKDTPQTQHIRKVGEQVFGALDKSFPCWQKARQGLHPMGVQMCICLALLIRTGTNVSGHFLPKRPPVFQDGWQQNTPAKRLTGFHFFESLHGGIPATWLLKPTPSRAC